MGSLRRRSGHEVGEERQRQDQIVEEDDAVHRVEGQTEAGREPALPCRERDAEERCPRDRGDAGRAVGEVRPVDEDEADDLAEGQGHDGEVVAAQAQHREAEQHAPQRRKQPGERQADPEGQPEGGGEQRVAVGAHRVEGDVAEVEQAREADDDVQAPAEHDIGEDQDAEVDPVARGAEAPGGQRRDERQRQGESDEEGHPEPGCLPVGDGDAAVRVARQRSENGRRPSPVAPGQEKPLGHAADEHHGAEGRDKTPARRQVQRAALAEIGAVADNGDAEAQRHERPKRSIAHQFTCAGSAACPVRHGRSCHARSDLLDLGPAEQARRHEDQDDGEDREGGDVLVLDGEIGRPEGLDQPDDEPAENRAGE